MGFYPLSVRMTLRAGDGFSFLRCLQVNILNEVCILLPHIMNMFFLFLEDDDDEVGEDEDEDDGFFVPHGYLSEDEGVTEVRERAGRGLSRELAGPSSATSLAAMTTIPLPELTHPGSTCTLQPQHIVTCGVAGTGA